nr:glycoside hydrolase family 3 C-terminal domain-containing protein [Hyphomonadaceae bacterium]
MMPLELQAAPVRQAEVSDRTDLVATIISRMTLAEKIGQLRQIDATAVSTDPQISEAVRLGAVGSIINLVDPDQIGRLQAVARHESRLGIPLLVARDVIHGFRTIFPIPLGQAASWNPDLVREAARISAVEAAAAGVNWTFSPMLDISRDARWGRIAESFGEDPFLTSRFGVAMVEGYQGDDLAMPDAIAACAKHFVGYGASEGGRDYNTTNIPPNELNNVYLPPFQAAVAAGAASVMSSFSDLDGVPATANKALLKDVLRAKWGFDGVLVSDWNAVQELVVHGYSSTDQDAAVAAVQAGVDIEMNGPAYAGLGSLLQDGLIEMAQIDDMVRRVLQMKHALGLFKADGAPSPGNAGRSALPSEVCRDLARQSVVMLKNDGGILPLRRDVLKSVALLGPLADAPAEQLGTWVFDGDPADSVTPLHALRDIGAGHFDVRFLPGLTNTRDRDTSRFDEAHELARASDLALVCIGEDAILSGEAHSRAKLDLPGAQRDLLEALRAAGK